LKHPYKNLSKFEERFGQRTKYAEGNKIVLFMEGEKINILNTQFVDTNFSSGTLKQPLDSFLSFLSKHFRIIVK